MAATGYTPIQLYYSTTPGATPLAANLLPGELAINIADGKLFYEDSGGTVQAFTSGGGGITAGQSIVYALVFGL